MVRICQHFAQPPKLQDHPLSSVRDYLFNIFAATLRLGGRSLNRKLRTRHAVVTGIHFLIFIYDAYTGVPGGMCQTSRECFLS